MDKTTLNLDSLPNILPPWLSPATGQYLAEAAAVCLNSQGHSSGVEMRVMGDFSERYRLMWGMVDDQMIRSHSDEHAAVEYGAYGIAILLVDELTDLTVVQRSRRGTGFDYWLGRKNEPIALFQGSARLEVSGIMRGGQANINRRVKEKIEQTAVSDGVIPAYVIVVEFGTPCSKVVKK
jgi:hypothetical protein